MPLFLGKMKIRAVLFDLDGTLIDSNSMWHDVDVKFMEEKGINYSADVLQKEIEGMAMNETAVYIREKFGLQETAEELVEIWNDVALEFYTKYVQIKPGALEFVKFLHENGIKMAIATSNSYFLASSSLEAKGFMPYLDSIVTANEVKAGKPSPDVYLKAAQNVGVDPKDCMVFEDVLPGVMAGLNANMKVSLIYDEYGSYNWEEKKKLADYSFMDYYEVMENYERIFN